MSNIKINFTLMKIHKFIFMKTRKNRRFFFQILNSETNTKLLCDSRRDINEK